MVALEMGLLPFPYIFPGPGIHNNTCLLRNSIVREDILVEIRFFPPQWHLKIKRDLNITRKQVPSFLWRGSFLSCSWFLYECPFFRHWWSLIPGNVYWQRVNSWNDIFQCWWIQFNRCEFWFQAFYMRKSALLPWQVLKNKAHENKPYLLFF